MIEERPKEANEIIIIRYFKSETIIGSCKQGAIMTYVFRKFRLLVADIMKDGKQDL